LLLNLRWRLAGDRDNWWQTIEVAMARRAVSPKKKKKKKKKKKEEGEEEEEEEEEEARLFHIISQ
jgi:ribosomal protein L12E/L44/L45/RPP1/RPP2